MRAIPFLLIIVHLLAGCDGTRAIAEVPEEIQGIWKTDAARYQKRFLEVRRKEVILGVGTVELDRLAIDRVDFKKEGEARIFRLHYMADEGYADHLELVVSSMTNPTLRVGKIPFKWRRKNTR